MAGKTIGQREKAAQKGLLDLGKQCHVHRSLTAAQHAAERNHQQLLEVMQSSIAAARIFQPFPTRSKLFQRFLAGHEVPPTKKLMHRSKVPEVATMVQRILKCDSPERDPFRTRTLVS